VLRAKFELGLFENPYVDTAMAAKLNGNQKHRNLALQAARESIVLLKNDGSILPLSPHVKTIAIIGTDATEARLGGYSGQGNNKISILEGIRQTAPDGTTILYSPGCGRTGENNIPVPAENLFHFSNGIKLNGLKAEYFDNIHLSGSPVLIRTDAAVDFAWTLYGPDPNLSNDWYSARWTGKLTAKTTGKYKIGIEGNDGYRLYLDGNLLIDNWVKKSFNTRIVEFSFIKNKEYDLRLEYYENTGNARLKLVWNAGVADTLTGAILKAVETSGKSDVVVIVAGIEEGEFRDRSSLKLPGRQEEMIQKIIATGIPVVVLLVGGSAVTMSNWIDKVQGILDVWYPGEAGGTAVAEVLFGLYNPAGRLPITFPIAEGQLPLVYNHKPTGRGNDYLDLSGMPLFPFGFGLSYSSFEYSDLQLARDTISTSDSVIVSFNLQNSGQVAGDEICQLYIHDELASVSRPVMELKGFKRIHLQSGESKKIKFSITPESLSMPDKNMNLMVEPGTFRITIGSSSTDHRLKRILTVQGK
jgi:beta-glucosidase